jgi:hypothetical protein
MVPVAPLGDTVAASVMAVPDVAEVADGVTVMVVVPLVLAEPELLPPQPIIKNGVQLNTITIRTELNAKIGESLYLCIERLLK